MTLQLYDDFSQSYTITQDGATSPNGKWKSVYNGGGSVVVANGVMTKGPNITGGLRANNLQSTSKWRLPHGKIRARLDAQNSNNTAGWYTFWLFDGYVDDTTHYYFSLKTTGWELGKKDNDLDERLELQQYLRTGTTPFATIGVWNDIEWTITEEFDSQLNRNNHRIKVWVNGSLVVDTFDRSTYKYKALNDGLDSERQKYNGTGWQRNGQTGIGASTFFIQSPKSVNPYEEASKASYDNFYIEDLAVVTPPPPDTEMPVIVLTSPANNSTITGDQVTVRGTSSDNIGVVKMESQIDSQPYVVMNKDASGYYMTYTGVTEGAHEARIRAIDAAGNSGIAQSFFRRLTVRRITTRAGDGKSELVISADSISSDKPIDVQ